MSDSMREWGSDLRWRPLAEWEGPFYDGVDHNRIPVLLWSRIPVLLWSPQFLCRPGFVTRFPDGDTYWSAEGYNGRADRDWGATHFMPYPKGLLDQIAKQLQ